MATSHPSAKVCLVRRWAGILVSAAAALGGSMSASASAVTADPLLTYQASITLEGRHQPVGPGAFSQDGARLITVTEDGSLRVWDSATGERLPAEIETSRLLASASFGPDGARILTISVDGTIHIEGGHSGRRFVRLAGHEGGVGSVSFSEVGARLATTGRDGMARVWDMRTGRAPLAQLRLAATSAASLSFSADGERMVSVGPDGSVVLRDARSGEARVELDSRHRIHPGMHAIVSGDGGHVLSWARGLAPTLWSAASGEPIAVLDIGERAIASAAFSVQGNRLVMAMADHTAQVWDVAAVQRVSMIAGHTHPISQAVFSPGGEHVLTASHDRTAVLWETGTGRPLARLDAHAGPLTAAAFSPDGAFIVTGDRVGVSRVWSAASGRPLGRLRRDDGEIRTIAFSPDSQRVLTLTALGARVRPVTTSYPRLRIEGSWDHAPIARFSADGARLIIGDSVHDAHSGAVLMRPDAPPVGTAQSAFMADDIHVITLSPTGHVRIWRADTGEVVHAFSTRTHAPSGLSASLSPDGQRMIMTAGTTEATLVNLDLLLSSIVIKADGMPIHGAQLSPDGERIALLVHDHSVRLVSAQTGEPLGVLLGHDGHIASASYSHDGARLVTASADGTARVWDVDSAGQIAIIPHDASAVTAAVFSPDGEAIVTATQEGRVRLWRGTSPR
jgi:WD40 repeat protein